MALWYAIICGRDMIDNKGKVEYPAGAVCSWGSEIDETALAERGMRAVAVGEFGEAGPDFSAVQWDPLQEKLVPILPRS